MEGAAVYSGLSRGLLALAARDGCFRPSPSITLLSLAKLQAVVASLGSGDPFGWWNCSFLASAGIEVLAYNFPRTAVSAAVTATSKAAALRHDQAAGAVGVFHLFRLPPAMMQRVHEHLLSRAGEWAGELTDKDRGMGALRDLAAGGAAHGGGPGARNLGSVAADDPSLASRLAAAYLAAFEGGYQTFPYFTLANDP